jgi:micrococcal nuclease
MRKTIGLGLLLILLSGQASARGPLIGKVDRVKDGDDLHLCDGASCHDIRLCGIDAPERHASARNARQALAELVMGKMVRCIPVGEGTVCDGRSKTTNRGRTVAQCFLGELDVAGVQAKAGHACDWEKFSGGYYKRLGGKPC